MDTDKRYLSNMNMVFLHLCWRRCSQILDDVKKEPKVFLVDRCGSFLHVLTHDVGHLQCVLEIAQLWRVQFNLRNQVFVHLAHKL